VVECGSLENFCCRKVTVGSNPTLSAIGNRALYCYNIYMYNERLRKQPEARKSIDTIKLTLEAIKRAQGQNYPQSMKGALLRSTANLAWEAIPEYVSALDLGDGVRIDRAPKDIERIPVEGRQVWGLERLDQHGAYLAQGLAQTWQPIFPKREA
jgi:hypothetical protein